MFKFFVSFSLALCLVGCSQQKPPNVNYETYIQINKVEEPEPNKIFVLVVAHNPNSPQDKKDTVQNLFLLSVNEKKTVTVLNKFYPARKYKITADVRQSLVKVTIDVSEGDDIIFHSHQRLVSWTGF